MRRVLGLLFLVSCPAVSAATAVSVSAERTPDATIVTFRATSPEGLAIPVLRLVPLPEGSGRAEVEPVGDAALRAGFRASAGDPMVLHGLRLLPLTLTPSGTVEKVGTAVREVSVAVRDAAPAGAVVPRMPRSFIEALRGSVPDELLPEASEQPGGYLVIADPALVDALAPLIAWKTEMGYAASIVTTQQTGPGHLQIRQFISDRYHDASLPPLEYVLLVGDVEQIPGFDFHAIVSDHPYALVDGEDFLPDVLVGRLPARNAVEAETMIAKILAHERDLYLDDGTDWYARGLVVAADYGSSTPVAVSRWMRDQMKEVDFAAVDSVFFPPFWTTGRALIRAAVDSGVSLVTYRGWANGTHGWDPPTFLDSDVYTLSNGWKLPVVMSFVCWNNDYSVPECFGEAWLRAGTAEVPKGGVAFIGNSEPWSHTRFNDAIAIGSFKGITEQGRRGLAAIMLAGKLELLQQFPLEIPYTQEGQESVEFYFHMYNLLGDPEMSLWTGAPREVRVTLPASLPLGSDFVDVRATEADGLTPVEGARVGVSQAGGYLGHGWTDAAGLAHVPAAVESQADPVTIAVTGANVAPYRATLAVSYGPAFLAGGAVTIDDDALGGSLGNGDGVANPGETIELFVKLRNRGSEGSGETAAALTTASGAVEILDAAAAYPPIPGGGEADPLDPFLMRIEAGAEDGARAALRLEASAAGIEESITELPLTIAAPALRFESAAALTGQEGNEILPGATVDLTVTLVNDGSLPTTGANVVLHDRSGGLLSVADSSASVGGLDPGGSAAIDAPFRFTVGSEVAIGQGLAFTLESATTEGAVCLSSFSLVVGTPRHDAPLGPDAYGYYAYDNSDTDYPDTAPLYEWIPCSTVYGGSGTKLPLRDNKIAVVDLPFAFTYYGQSYTRIAVSDNGWFSFDPSTYYDYYNWRMPNSYGNDSQVAAFWDNLDPEKELDGHPVADGVYVFHDAARDRFVIEWSRMGQVPPPCTEDPSECAEYDDLQTFQAVLYDPASAPTPTGDGIIQFQYKQITNNDKLRMYATVGIEDQTESVGLEITYSNVYPDAAAPISAGLAIRFSTQPPRYVPFRLASFAAIPEGENVLLAWEPVDARPRGGYRVYREVEGKRTPLTPAPLPPGARSFLDTEADADAPAAYTIGSLDPTGRERLLGPFLYEGRAAGALRLALAARSANPSRGALTFDYALPARARVTLRIHDLAGRRVRTLVDQVAGPGRWSAVWDGRDGAGREMASGVYLCRLEAAGSTRSLKSVLLR